MPPFEMACTCWPWSLALQIPKIIRSYFEKIWNHLESDCQGPTRPKLFIKPRHSLGNRSEIAPMCLGSLGDRLGYILCTQWGCKHLGGRRSTHHLSAVGNAFSDLNGMATPKKSEKSSITIPLSYPFEDFISCKWPKLRNSETWDISNIFPTLPTKIWKNWSVLCHDSTDLAQNSSLLLQASHSVFPSRFQRNLHQPPMKDPHETYFRHFCYSVDQWHRCFPGLNPDHWDHKPLHSPERDHRDPWRFPVSSVSRQTQAENLRKALESAFEPLFS